MTQVGNSFSAAERSQAEIITYADTMPDMFCAYIERFGTHHMPASATS